MSYSSHSSSISSLILDTNMDIDSGDTNIYSPTYLSKNYYKIVFPNNSTLSSSHSSHSSCSLYSLYSSHSSHSTSPSPSLQSQYYSYSNSVLTNSHFSE